MSSAEDNRFDEYVDINYDQDSHIVKEVTYIVFASKEYYTPDLVDPENYQVSDFKEFTEYYQQPSSTDIQDIGNYYLLTFDYKNLDDIKNVNSMQASGLISLPNDGSGLIDADSTIDLMKESGATEGIPAWKEYAKIPGQEDVFEGIESRRLQTPGTEEGLDGYATVYYGRDSHVVQAIVWELFYSKSYYMPESAGTESVQVSDFVDFSELRTAWSYEGVQDIGDYYLVTLEYGDLYNMEHVADMASSGLIIWEEEGRDGDMNKKLMSADAYIESMKERGYVEGDFSDKEYAAYFGSGRFKNN